VSGLEVTLPPLRERGHDIIVLAEEMLRQTIAKHQLASVHFSDAARQALLAYRWPGNVRELERAVETAAILVGSGEITAEAMANRFKPVAQPSIDAGVEDPGRVAGAHDLVAASAAIEKAVRTARALGHHEGDFSAPEFGKAMGVKGASYRKRLLQRLSAMGVVESHGAARATRYRIVSS
jgi:DNA-binding NtrC family response regulator